MVAVIVLSQLVGPPFFKFAIKQVGEAHLKGEGEHDEVRDVVIVGIENQSRALADQLRSHNWQDILADIDPSHVTKGAEDDVPTHLLEDITKEGLSNLIKSNVDAVVAMLPDDDLNLRLCELAYEMFGVNRLVVRLNDYSRIGEFQAIGATVVYPSSAMVHLLDNVVRAPQLASLVLHDDPENEMVQITITDPDIDGLHIRDVILPNDILVVSIIRDGHSIVPHGYTTLHLYDEVTLLGVAKSLEEVTLKLGY
jgi:Trk K+ transport system NAD-binding subunit